MKLKQIVQDPLAKALYRSCTAQQDPANFTPQSREDWGRAVLPLQQKKHYGEGDDVNLCAFIDIYELPEGYTADLTSLHFEKNDVRDIDKSFTQRHGNRKMFLIPLFNIGEIYTCKKDCPTKHPMNTKGYRVLLVEDPDLTFRKEHNASLVVNRTVG